VLVYHFNILSYFTTLIGLSKRQLITLGTREG